MEDYVRSWHPRESGGQKLSPPLATDTARALPAYITLIGPEIAGSVQMVDGWIFANWTLCAHCRLVLDAYAIIGKPLAAANSMGAPCETCSSRQMNPGAIAAASMGKALSSTLHGKGQAVSWLIIVGQRSLLGECYNSLDLHGL